MIGLDLWQVKIYEQRIANTHLEKKKCREGFVTAVAKLILTMATCSLEILWGDALMWEWCHDVGVGGAFSLAAADHQRACNGFFLKFACLRFDTGNMAKMHLEKLNYNRTLVNRK